jgi:hypothetical protein
MKPLEPLELRPSELFTTLEHRVLGGIRLHLEMPGGARLDHVRQRLHVARKVGDKKRP